MNRLDELTRKDLIADVDTWTKNKSKKVPGTLYLGITEDYTVFFRARSASGNGSYVVKITLVDYPEVAEDEDMTTAEKVRLAIAGDLKISCTCPAYLYWGYKYILTQLDTNESDPENRYPRIRNPKLQGVLCKHAYTTLNAFPFNYTRIAKDIESGHYLR